MNEALFGTLIETSFADIVSLRLDELQGVSCRRYNLRSLDLTKSKLLFFELNVYDFEEGPIEFLPSTIRFLKFRGESYDTQRMLRILKSLVTLGQSLPMLEEIEVPYSWRSSKRSCIQELSQNCRMYKLRLKFSSCPFEAPVQDFEDEGVKIKGFSDIAFWEFVRRVEKQVAEEK